MVFLGLGSNLEDREQNITNAINMLDNHPQVTVYNLSSLYESEPVGLKDQPIYLNAVAHILTTLTPFELLKVCLNIEKSLGRVRTTKWGPRIIDIDILLFGNLTISTSELTLPHPYFHKRRFVLIPMDEIAHGIPLYNGMTAQELSETAEKFDVKLYKNLEFA